MVKLSDYRPAAFHVDEVELDFDLHPQRTRVKSRFTAQRQAGGPLTLDGEGLTLVSIAMNGGTLGDGAYTVDGDRLVIADAPDTAALEIEVEIDPSANTALMGLYLSGGRFCTQCEAQGFRKITWFLDRPDALSRYTVRVEADRADYPTLLANGDRVEGGDLDGGRHYAVFRDPFPKPCYLFALVAGRFDTIEDRFTTMSGRDVRLAVHVDPGDAERAWFAMDSLKRSMAWDETAFRREYDLGEFHIVAVRDFNFGAMENKGLNIFNSSLLLADAATATDADFLNVERVVAHEYFHNWTGNRITLRDWFQLCLKEGLTVFRDQEFTADERSRPLQRIADVESLRAVQFPEDGGPLAHPPRPPEYETIDNFYTATVYNKGAEVVRVLREVVGPDAFETGMQRYFDECDGKAATLEDFVGAFAAESGKDLAPFFGWYTQAGTPKIAARHVWDAAAGTLTLTVTQANPATPGQPDKRPLPVPLRIGFIDESGRELAARLDGHEAKEHHVILDTAERVFVFEGLSAEPVPAILRGFNAPVALDPGLNADQRLIQMAHDPDAFTRWDAGQSLLSDAIIARAEGRSQDGPALDRIAAALAAELDRAAEDPGFAARALRVPGLGLLIQQADTPDPEALFQSRKAVRAHLAEALRDRLAAVLNGPRADAADTSPEAMGRRALSAAALDLIAATGDGAPLKTAFDAAGGMTETMAALGALAQTGGPAFAEALEAFHARWQGNPLVMDKWFQVQAMSPLEGAPGRMRALADHPLFTLSNPNRARALYGAFAAGNPRHFHAADGSGYELVAEAIGKLDKANPMTAARLVRAFESWKRFDEGRQGKAKAALERLKADGISTNLKEMVDRTLG